MEDRPLRRGKWKGEEQDYAERLIEAFLAGTVPDCADGTTMRAFLSLTLHCAPMRITKKFAGATLGKAVFRRTGQLDPARRRDLEDLRERFLRSESGAVSTHRVASADTTWAQRVAEAAARSRKDSPPLVSVASDTSDDDDERRGRDDAELYGWLPPNIVSDSADRRPSPLAGAKRRRLDDVTSAETAQQEPRKSKPISIHTTGQGLSALKRNHALASQLLLHASSL